MSNPRKSGAAGKTTTSSRNGGPQQQPQNGATAATAIPKRAVTSMQAQYRKVGDLHAAMGKTMTDLGVPLPT